MADSATKHTFLSYVHEDSDPVDTLDRALDAAGIDIWRDTRSLWPGEDWKSKIRSAIRNGSLAFVACFSSTSTSKQRTYQNEEITLAIEEVRLRQPGTQWLFPVRLDECDIPDFDLGSGRTLSDLHFTDLFGPNAQVNLVRLITSISRLLEPERTAAQVAQAILAETDSDPRTLIDRVKTLLRDPQGDIRLEETVDDVAERVRDELADESRFPNALAAGTTDSEAANLATKYLVNTEATLEPLLNTMILASTYGEPQHAQTWRRASELIADLYDPAGQSLMAGLRQYPMAMLLQAVAMAGAERGNFWTLRAVAIDTEVTVRDARGPALNVFSQRNIFERFDWLGSAVAVHLDDGTVIDERRVNTLKTRGGGRWTPASDILFTRLRPYFARLVRQDARYEQLFDRGTVILDALTWDVRLQGGRGNFAWPNFGRYTWKYQVETSLETSLGEEPALKNSMISAGLFGGSAERFDAAFTGLAEQVARIRERRF